jgi:phospholipase C
MLTKAAGSDLGAVEHVVILTQENASFDHYFGTLRGVRGFDDVTNRQSFQQSWPGGHPSSLLPFHLDTKSEHAECLYCLDHSWQAEHASWNNGAMDAFLSYHTGSVDGELGVNTMGYYEAADIPFYFDLAEKFTICDNYFCSVLGPTHPNRLMQMTGTCDPEGLAGGPILITNTKQRPYEFTCDWQTMPEALQDARITWKVYNPSGPLYQPGAETFLSYNMLLYMKQFREQNSPTLHQNAFGYFGPVVKGGSTTGKGPNDFAMDVLSDTLPQVSWIVSPLGFDEHPPAPVARGEWFTHQILDALLSNPKVWAKTVLFITYDENGGYFDHVPPPVPPIGTPGEFVTAERLPSSDFGFSGPLGPIGFGVRVPMLVVSPFSAGGNVVSDTFDHTSQLLFIEKRFGVKAPNISDWRRSVTGDLTSTLTSYGRPIQKAPRLLSTSADALTDPIANECTVEQLVGYNPRTAPYPVPSSQRMPRQG